MLVNYLLLKHARQIIITGRFTRNQLIYSLSILNNRLRYDNKFQKKLNHEFKIWERLIVAKLNKKNDIVSISFQNFKNSLFLYSDNDDSK